MKKSDNFGQKTIYLAIYIFYIRTLTRFNHFFNGDQVEIAKNFSSQKSLKAKKSKNIQYKIDKTLK